MKAKNYFFYPVSYDPKILSYREGHYDPPFGWMVFRENFSSKFLFIPSYSFADQ
jgi:hypothetical protein